MNNRFNLASTSIDEVRTNIKDSTLLDLLNKKNYGTDVPFNVPQEYMQSRVPSLEPKPHYLSNEESLLKLALEDIGIPKRIIGERGLIDPERNRLIFKKIQDMFGQRVSLPFRGLQKLEGLMENQNPRNINEAIPPQGSSGRMF